VKLIIDEFGINVRVKALTVLQSGKLHYADVIKNGDKPAPLITLCRNHWINDLLDCGITGAEIGLEGVTRLTSSRLLVELFKLGMMKPLDIKHMPHNKLQQPPIPDLAYNPKHCLDRTHSIKAKTVTIDDVRSDPRQSPKYGRQMLSKVLNGCAAVSGVVKSFIKQALHGARIWGVAGTYDNLTILDINSLYPYAMTRHLCRTARRRYVMPRRT
jgi:hypothetical protein